MGVMAARLRRATLQAQIDQYALHWELPMVVIPEYVYQTGAYVQLIGQVV